MILKWERNTFPSILTQCVWLWEIGQFVFSVFNWSEDKLHNHNTFDISVVSILLLKCEESVLLQSVWTESWGCRGAGVILVCIPLMWPPQNRVWSVVTCVCRHVVYVWGAVAPKIDSGLGRKVHLLRPICELRLKEECRVFLESIWRRFVCRATDFAASAKISATVMILESYLWYKKIKLVMIACYFSRKMTWNIFLNLLG